MSQTGLWLESAVGAAGAADRGWQALYVRHQHERAVAQTLAAQGLEGYVPLFGAVRQWKDRSKRLLLPLFPCYVFLRGGWQQHKSRVLSIPGVCSMVSSGGAPAAIPDQEIDAIRKAVEHGAGVEPHPFLRCGERVRIKSGRLADVEGILVRYKNSLRLVLSAVLLERSVALEVDAGNVEPVRA